MPDDLDLERCTYCGKQIPVDIVRCPACGEYTDGAGPLASLTGWTPRKIFLAVVAAIAIIAFLAMILGGC